MPLAPSLIVNSEECLRLIDQMRISIPSAIKESERMITERDRIISDAQARAEQIIAHAEQQAIQIVSEDAITERAREEAERIIAHGHAEAIRLVDEAEVYALGCALPAAGQTEQLAEPGREWHPGDRSQPGAPGASRVGRNRRRIRIFLCHTLR